MHKIILVLAAIVVIGSWDCVTPGASAGELAVVRHSRCGGIGHAPFIAELGALNLTVIPFTGRMAPTEVRLIGAGTPTAATIPLWAISAFGNPWP